LSPALISKVVVLCERDRDAATAAFLGPADEGGLDARRDEHAASEVGHDVDAARQAAGAGVIAR